MTRAPDTVKRGRLSAEEKAAIIRLADSMQTPTPGKIARRLNRHVSTVNWYMIRHGLLERPIKYRAETYTRRDGVIVRPFTAIEDQRLLSLRRDGKVPAEIAAILVDQFGYRRTPHSVQVRLVLLAAYSDGPEGEASSC